MPGSRSESQTRMPAAEHKHCKSGLWSQAAWIQVPVILKLCELGNIASFLSAYFDFYKMLVVILPHSVIVKIK